MKYESSESKFWILYSNWDLGALTAVCEQVVNVIQYLYSTNESNALQVEKKHCNLETKFYINISLQRFLLELNSLCKPIF